MRTYVNGCAIRSLFVDPVINYHISAVECLDVNAKFLSFMVAIHYLESLDSIICCCMQWVMAQ